MNNPIEIHLGKVCSCGKMCKNTRGLKIHQEKVKCYTPENKLTALPKNVLYPCKILFCHHALLLMIVSIKKHLTTLLFLSPILKSQLLAANAMYKHIFIQPLLNTWVMTSTSVAKKSCRTCNIFVSNQSNLTCKEYNTISYDRLLCCSNDVIYGIHCIHCCLVHVDETGRSLRSRMNGHRSSTNTGVQSLLHRHLHQPDHSVCKSLGRFIIVLKIQPCSLHFAGSENCSGSRSMTKSKGSVP